MPDKLLVFVPCYNCAPQVTRVLGQFDEKVTRHFSEILLLDNGSRDNTIAAAVDAARNIKGITVTIAKNRANYNLGGSHKAAFRYAVENGFTHVVVLHGDDQGNISDLIPVLINGNHRLQDACLGARFMSGSRLVGYSAFRIFGNRVFNFLFTLGTRVRVKDLGSGLNIFGRRVIEDERLNGYADDLRFNVYLLLGMLEKRMKVEYFPISWREDDQVSNVKMTSQALRTLRLFWQSIFEKSTFWLKDHREIAHKNYKFDVVHKTWGSI
jgi:dolichol-phosphate mannosyltransferase